MIIHPKDKGSKNENNGNKPHHGGRPKFNKRSVLIYVSIAFLILGLGGITILKVYPLVKIWLVNHGLDVSGGTRIAVMSYFGNSQNYSRTIRNVFQTVEVPKLAINIKFKNFQKISRIRQKALEKGVLLQGQDDFAPAIIEHEGRSIKVKLRLKGDWVDHFDTKKWSLRVHVGKKNHILGMRRFSIQHPKTRNYLMEKLVHDTHRLYGVLAPRYHFVDVSVNGDSWGLMALEEHFSKEMYESQKRKEGVVIRFDESLMWRIESEEGPNFPNPYKNYIINHIDSFRSSRISKSKKLSVENSFAVGLLRGFIEGNLSVTEVFDTELYGRFLAANTFWVSGHGLPYSNLRFYYNPITAKLEPISWDAMGNYGYFDWKLLTVGLSTGYEHLTNPNYVDLNAFTFKILHNPDVFEAFIRTLKDMTENFSSGELLKFIKQIEVKNNKILHSEYYFLPKLPYNKLIQHADFLYSIVKSNPQNLAELEAAFFTQVRNDYPVLIKVYEINEEEQQYLELINMLPTRMEVLNIEWAKRGETVRRPLNSSQSFPQVLEASPYWDHSLKSRSKPLRFPLEKFKDMDDWEVIVTARISGKEVTHQVKAEPYYTPLTKPPIPESTVADQLKIHKFFDFKPQTNTLSVKRGEWNVKGWIIVPKGIRLVIPAGVTLNFGFNGGLLSRGVLEFNGSENAPIFLKASGEGKRKSWLGVAVLNSDKVSKWTHVRVTDTMGLRNGKWELTGGVTFHKSDILMDNCVIERHKGEDALNIIRSNFKLSNIRIEDTQSDAFDSDFSNGEIVGGNFQNIGKGSGGDAIDLSGSRITVNGTNFMNVSDKAFSVGEKSHLNVTDVSIDEVGAGLVSKDDSKILINSSFIKNAQIAGLMAYIKKNEFGSSQIIARDIKFELTNVPGLAQKGSSITLNGVKLPEEDLDVVQLYQTLMKSSK